VAVISGALDVLVPVGARAGCVSAPATPPAGVSVALATATGVCVAVDVGAGGFVSVGSDV
jgi:hypothetical protein